MMFVSIDLRFNVGALTLGEDRHLIRGIPLGVYFGALVRRLTHKNGRFDENIVSFILKFMKLS